ncbi:hypothetical protein [Cohnella fermenti]|uniref:Uncharacterized protein n=1 Tax=Cohnella fermenti TaxID=2565925 RepID=A0A4S4BI34_9BACL|nr:hypothetical protein [Cohnella fermenti]THF73216.1 hypothetical protein E6C55_30165 [Cohnella fermenti]
MNVNSVQPVSNYLKSMQQGKDGSRLASIRNVLMMGKKLSSGEMNYLQRYDPNLHNQAMSISKERQAYEDALQHSRSKAAADYYHTFKLMQIAGQLKHGGSEELQMRANAIQEAHREFVRSSKYASLK